MPLRNFAKWNGLVYAKLKLPEEGCEEMGKSKGKKKRTTPNNQNQISLIIEIIKLITAIISLIGIVLTFLREIGLF